MKQSVSPVAMAAIVVVVIGVIGFFGWKMFFSGPARGGSKPSVAQEDAKFRQQYQNYGGQRRNMNGPRGDMGTGGPGAPSGPGGPGGPSGR